MYEKMRNEFLTSICERKTLTIQNVLDSLDCVMNHYEVQEKELSLSPEFNDDLPETAKMYLVIKKMSGLAEGTLSNYKKMLEMFFDRVRKQPEDIMANDIRMFLFEYQSTRNVTLRSLDKYREYICRFFDWANEEGYITTNPAKSITPIRHEVKPRQALTQIELEYLRNACRDNRDSAILETLYSTGCRVSELVGLKLEDIDWDTKSVHLFGKGKKHRTSFLNARAEVALKKYLKERGYESEFVFCSENKPHNKLTRASIDAVIKRIAGDSEVTKHVTPHIIRHTTATLALQHGMPVTDIQRLLGHESVSTTMIYAETSTENVQSEHKKYII